MGADTKASDGHVQLPWSRQQGVCPLTSTHPQMCSLTLIHWYTRTHTHTQTVLAWQPSVFGKGVQIELYQFILLDFDQCNESMQINTPVLWTHCSTYGPDVCIYQEDPAIENTGGWERGANASTLENPREIHMGVHCSIPATYMTLENISNWKLKKKKKWIKKQNSSGLPTSVRSTVCPGNKPDLMGPSWYFTSDSRVLARS